MARVFSGLCAFMSNDVRSVFGYKNFFEMFSPFLLDIERPENRTSAKAGSTIQIDSYTAMQPASLSLFRFFSFSLSLFLDSPHSIAFLSPIVPHRSIVSLVWLDGMSVDSLFPCTSLSIIRLLSPSFSIYLPLLQYARQAAAGNKAIRL